MNFTTLKHVLLTHTSIVIILSLLNIAMYYICIVFYNIAFFSFRVRLKSSYYFLVHGLHFISLLNYSFSITVHCLILEPFTC